MSAPVTGAPGRAEVAERVAAVRALLAAEGLDGVLVGSDDRFLNEYVPRSDSTRTWLTGFTGSTGDAFLGRDTGFVAVDGRYYLQADEQCGGGPFEVVRVALGVPVLQTLCERVARWARETGARRVAFAPGRVSARARATLEAALGTGCELVGVRPSLVERARGVAPEELRPLRAVAPGPGGGAVRGKLARLAPALAAAGVSACVVQKLDELAWLTNLRGDELPYQATFRAAGLLRAERVVTGLPGPERAASPEDGVELAAAALGQELDAALAGVRPGERVGYDPVGTTAAALEALRAAGAEPVELASPIAPVRARKAPEELAAMRAALELADRVMEEAIAGVQARLDAGQRVTETDAADLVEAGFRARGAVGLSFQVIAGAGANGAHIHGRPDPTREIAEGELVLVDMGGYFHEGYATDLTRTFLAGSASEPTPAQRERYTRVLQAAIAGMSARFPRGTRGEQLDALVRRPMWAHGLDYQHGTGHGVGVNVHEAPPRISTQPSTALEEGQVFSIEPGLYVQGWGGIRIENLCTVAPLADAPGFLEVVPLTFAAFDRRLIDEALLSSDERAWLERYEARGAEARG
ncbi:MAG: M24 family metallopeptidase [Planctomycetota bacterium]